MVFKKTKNYLKFFIFYHNFFIVYCYFLFLCEFDKLFFG
jgi:hypothetical protein